MSLLRRLLLVKPLNRTARGVGRLVMSGESFARFDRKLPLVDDFQFQLPSGQIIRWTPVGDAVLTKKLRYGGWNGYEPVSVELFYALAKHARVTLDVGAYLGYFAMLAAGAERGNVAYAFEAVPGLAAHARRLFGMNSELKVKLVESVVSDRPGTVEFYLSDDPFAPDASADGSHRAGRKPTSLQAIKLDDFVAEQKLPSVDLMKIDTETTEPAVLRGAAESIRRFRPTMLIEVLPSARVEEFNQFMADFNYTCASVTPQGLTQRPQVVPMNDEEEYNYLFFPKNKPGPMDDAIRAQLNTERL